MRCACPTARLEPARCRRRNRQAHAPATAGAPAWMRAGGIANRMVGLDHLRPLFIGVAESTGILGPIDHFGWATACAGVAGEIVPAAAWNGPPDAVQRIRATSAGASSPPGTGTPRCARCRSRLMQRAAVAGSLHQQLPASTSDSLLTATAALAGACRGAGRGTNPAARRSPPPRCRRHRRPPARQRGIAGMRFGRPAGIAQAIAQHQIGSWVGDLRRAVIDSGAARNRPSTLLLPAAGMLADRRSGWPCMASSADVPIEPVAPNAATRCITAGPSPRPPQKPKPVALVRTPATASALLDAVGTPPWPGSGRQSHPDMAPGRLSNRVMPATENPRWPARPARPPTIARPGRAGKQGADHRDHHRQRRPAARPSRVLFGLIRGANLRPPDQRPAEAAAAGEMSAGIPAHTRHSASNSQRWPVRLGHGSGRGAHHAGTTTRGCRRQLNTDAPCRHGRRPSRNGARHSRARHHQATPISTVKLEPAPASRPARARSPDQRRHHRDVAGQQHPGAREGVLDVGELRAYSHSATRTPPRSAQRDRRGRG